MTLSIVISTWNRARDLERFLASLAKQQLKPGRTWEVVVVDNNSTDDTAAVVRGAPPLPGGAKLTYVFEPRQGKSFGMNAGFAACSGSIVAFTDDDVILPENWLDAIGDYFEANPEAACVGGMVKLYNPEDAPVCIRLSTERRIVGAGEFSAVNIPIMGCNMAVRADVLREIGAFDVDLGPGARVGAAAEDMDYLFRLLRAGYPIHYAPEIALFHNHGRRTPLHLDRLFNGYLLGRGAFYCKYVLKRDWQVAKWFYWECVNYLGFRTLRAPFDTSVRKELKMLWLLVKGAFRYALFRQPSSVAARG